MEEVRITRLEKDIEENKRDIAQNRGDIVDLKTRLAIAENNIRDIKGELTTIKSNTTWIIRLIIGAIALAVIGFVISGGTKA
jgi:predicted  nucleic acid-binding Zn-ribbon protein